MANPNRVEEQFNRIWRHQLSLDTMETRKAPMHA